MLLLSGNFYSLSKFFWTLAGGWDLLCLEKIKSSYMSKSNWGKMSRKLGCAVLLIVRLKIFVVLQWFYGFKLQGIECIVWQVQKSRSDIIPWQYQNSPNSMFQDSGLVFTLPIWAGFEILAFPCNQFARQEPGNNEEIQETLCTRFKAEFPIFDKVIIIINQDVFEVLYYRFVPQWPSTLNIKHPGVFRYQML